MRAYISGATLLVVGVLLGVLIAPTVRGSTGTGWHRLGSESRPAASASAGGRPGPTGTAGPTGTTPAPGGSPGPGSTVTGPSASAGSGGSARSTATPSAVPKTRGASSISTAPGAFTVDLARPVVVGFGDSITFNPHSWIRQLCEAGTVLQNCANAGIRGNTTGQMLARLDEDVLSYDPSVVIVMGGTNDLKHHASTKAILRRLDAIIDRIRATGATAVICTVPPRRHYETQALALNTAIRTYADRGNVPLLDLYDSIGARDGDFRKGLTGDGVHPNRRGADRMTRSAAQQLPALLSAGPPPPGR